MFWSAKTPELCTPFGELSTEFGLKQKAEVPCIFMSGAAKRRGFMVISLLDDSIYICLSFVYRPGPFPTPAIDAFPVAIVLFQRFI
jgi:hypothetical protein